MTPAEEMLRGREDEGRIPGRNELMRLGVRQWVANEYRRLLIAGVDPQTAGILARSPARSYSRRRTACGWGNAQIHSLDSFVDNRRMADTEAAIKTAPGPAARTAGRAPGPNPRGKSEAPMSIAPQPCDKLQGAVA